MCLHMYGEVLYSYFVTPIHMYGSILFIFGVKHKIDSPSISI